MVVLDTTKSDFHIKASSLRKDEVFNLLVYMSALQSFCKRTEDKFYWNQYKKDCIVYKSLQVSLQTLKALQALQYL